MASKPTQQRTPPSSSRKNVRFSDDTLGSGATGMGSPTAGTSVRLPRSPISSRNSNGARNLGLYSSESTEGNTIQVRESLDIPQAESSLQAKSIEEKAIKAMKALDISRAGSSLQTNINLLREATTPSPLSMGQDGSSGFVSPLANLGPLELVHYRKRKRVPDDEADRRHEVEADSGGPMVALQSQGSAAANQPSTKRMRTNNGVAFPSLQDVAQSLQDIVASGPKPRQLPYEAHPIGDRSDAFYTEAFRLLFNRVETMVSTYFCFHNLDMEEAGGAWADIKLSPEFVTWADQVAESDTVGWDEMLRDTTQRKWLIMGIIMKVLRVKIFDADLFGSNQQQKELLFSIERAMLSQEGFSRTALRSETCRTIIGGGPVTQNFYPKVNELTAQIALLLGPLTSYLYTFRPAQWRALPALQQMYQSLHNIVSDVAFLSLCIRLSPSVFYITDIRPGTVYEPDEQHSLEEHIYNKSRQTAQDDYTALYLDPDTAHQRKARILQTAAARHAKDVTQAEWMASKKALIQFRNDFPPPPAHTHRTLIQIAVWPVITRYKPGSAAEDNSNIPLHQKDGFRIYPISKGAAVCYFGESPEHKRRVWAAEEARGSLPVLVPKTLDSWVRVKKAEREECVRERRRQASSRIRRRVVGYGAAALAAAAAGAVYSVVPPETSAANVVANVVDLAAQQIKWFY